MGILTHVRQEDPLLCRSRCVFLKGRGGGIPSLALAGLVICGCGQEPGVPQHSWITFRINSGEREELES